MPPRRKRTKRPARLAAARHWLPTFNGKSVVRGYAKWFGVDLGCAVKELHLLGGELDPQYVQALRTTLQNRRRRRSSAEPGLQPTWEDSFGYIAGFTSGGAPFGATCDDSAFEEDPGWRVGRAS